MVDETLRELGAMNPGAQGGGGGYPADRMTDYTRPGYEAYGHYLVEEVRPWVDADRSAGYGGDGLLAGRCRLPLSRLAVAGGLRLPRRLAVAH